MGRALSPANRFARYAGVASLAVLAGACKTQMLDAGYNQAPDACAASDLGSLGCAPAGLLDNLVGYWRLDDGPGSAVALDSSGRNNQGILRNLDTSAAWVAGRSQGALRIAHTGWVQVAPSPSIDSISDQVTLSAWVNLESSITSSDIFGTALSRQVGTTVDQHYHLSVSMDGRPTLFIATVSGYVSPQGNPTSMRTWIHLAGVYDGTMVRFYVDGAEVASAALTGTFVPDTTPIILGGNGNDASEVPTELFPGRIDELMLYARALSAAEIGQLAAGVLFRT
jgi:hypothetical protein